MTDEFDPYYEWFGIGPNERPLNHYLLLGLPLRENDSKRISNAADQRVAYLRSLQQGKRAKLTQRLLGEVAAAARCLLDPPSKETYDETLPKPAPLSTNGPANVESDSASDAANAYSVGAPPIAMPMAPPTPSQAPLVDPMAPVQLASEYLGGGVANVEGPPIASMAEAPPIDSPRQEPGIRPPLAVPTTNASPIAIAAAASSLPEALPPKSDVDAPPVQPQQEDGEQEEGGSPWLRAAILLAIVLLTACGVVGAGLVFGWFDDKSPTKNVDSDPPEVILKAPDSSDPKENEVAVVTQEGDGSLRFSPSFARIASDIRLVNVGGEMVTRGWTSTDQEVVWRARVVKPGVFQARITYASSGDAPAGQLEISVNDKSQDVSLRGSGGYDKFVNETFFLAIPRKGVSEIRLRAKAIEADGFIELKALECAAR